MSPRGQILQPRSYHSNKPRHWHEGPPLVPMCRFLAPLFSIYIFILFTFFSQKVIRRVKIDTKKLSKRKSMRLIVSFYFEIDTNSTQTPKNRHKMKKIDTKLRLVAIFAIAMNLSFIPEMFPEYFGDWVCEGGKAFTEGNTYRVDGCSYGSGNAHMPCTHWGFRHWMWTLCGTVLFIWNTIELFPKSRRNV